MEALQLKDPYRLEIQDRADCHEVQMLGAGIGVMPMPDVLTEEEHTETTNRSLLLADFICDRDPPISLPYSHK